MKRLLIAMCVSVLTGTHIWACSGPVDTQILIMDGWKLEVDPLVVDGQLPDTVCEVECSWAAGGSEETYWGAALYLGDGAKAQYRFADEPVFGTLSMMIYDRGASGPAPEMIAGPKWGVQHNPQANDVPGPIEYDVVMGVELSWDGPGQGNQGYVFDNGALPGQPGILPNGDLPYRRVTGDLPADAGVYDPANNVQGAWSRWTFAVHDGLDMLFTVSDPDGSNEQSWTVVPALDSVFDTGFSTNGFNQVFLYGGLTDGSGLTDHVGLWVDEIIFTPDVGQGATGYQQDFGGGCNTGGCWPYCGIDQGDFNQDGEVGLLDLDILGENWGRSGVGVEPYDGDANWDRAVGLLDLDIVGQNWGQSVLITAPEPGGLMVIIVVCASVLYRR